MAVSTNPNRRTIVAHGRLAMRELRLNAARQRLHGLQIFSFEQLAVRLAGGFTRPIHDESLRSAIQAVVPETPLGELDGIKLLPGMIDAAADTLHKVWRSGIDLAARAHEHPRLESIARLEAAVQDRLPPGMMRPADLASAALKRLAHAPAILGSVEIVGITELSPSWRPLLAALAAHVPVAWVAGPRPVPEWLAETDIEVRRSDGEGRRRRTFGPAGELWRCAQARPTASRRSWPADPSRAGTGRSEPCLDLGRHRNGSTATADGRP
ncbi:hypothetical protein [Sphingomonas yabuuchiae]|uniref:hypothetical protein n=1 Tax=Sphingomonas yabuuchiae TaxID=172044 RepID=UPI0031F62E37